VEARAGERGEPGPVRVAGDAEQPGRRDHRVELVLLTVRGGQHVAGRGLFPGQACDPGVQPQVRAQAEHVDDVFGVGQQLGLGGVGPRPLVLQERVRVGVGVDVDLAARVAVVPPGPADAVRLLEDDELGAGALAQPDRGGEAAEPGTDDGYAHRTPRAASSHGAGSAEPRGASASMSVTTSIRAGPLLASALCSAPSKSAAFLTVSPSTPIDSATRAKSVSLKCQSSPCLPCSEPPYAAE